MEQQDKKQSASELQQAVLKKNSSFLDNERLMALSYIIPFLLSLWVIFSDKKRIGFYRYHALNSLALSVLALAVSVGLFFICIGLIYLTGPIGIGFAWFTAMLFFLYGIYCIYLALKTYQGEYVKIPFLETIVNTYFLRLK